MNMWLMYFVLMLSNIQAASVVACILTIILLVIWRIAAWRQFDDSSEDVEDKKIYRATCKKIKLWCMIPVILFVASTFIPDTQTAAALYVLPKIINNKQVRKMPDKLVTLANSWMDEQIKTIKSK